MAGDLWRFYLLYNRPEGRDVNFSWEELDKAINGILISNVANLINRVLSFVQTRYDRVVPDTLLDPEVTDRLDRARASYEKEMGTGSLGRALRVVCSLAVFGNEYFQRKAPWATEDAQGVASAFHLIKVMAILLSPFLPEFSGSILQSMGVSEPCWEEIEAMDAGQRITGERVLLERIDVEEMRKKVEAPVRKMVTFSEVEKLDLRVGTIRAAEPIPNADRLYRLTIDIGGETLTSVAGIRTAYSPDQLTNQRADECRWDPNGLQPGPVDESACRCSRQPRTDHHPWCKIGVYDPRCEG
jgi:methionyl-tRNA synthetase